MKNYLWEITVLPSANLSLDEAINRELNSKYVYHIGNVKEIQTYCKQNYKNDKWYVEPIKELE